ncbi:hypothetical protein [Endozoicomonas sp.]|uniref:hypothetical protein n=1 Tax=Endozoicomonas sp. TaxID=1892382 RepID=UPI00383AF0AD
MTSSRRNLIDTASTRYYHCIARCVRRAWLCGQDDFSGKNFEQKTGVRSFFFKDTNRL